jgi:hypothetical protein
MKEYQPLQQPKPLKQEKTQCGVWVNQSLIKIKDNA